MEPIVIYDGDCAFCSSAARFAQARISPDLRFSAHQLTDLSQYGLTTEQCQQALQYVAADQRIFSGHKAVIQVLKNGSWYWKLIGLLIGLPGFTQITAIGYRLIATNRHKLPGGTPTCRLQ